eukprot:5098410-Pleurochrysis_carterae.AAC.1
MRRRITRQRALDALACLRFEEYSHAWSTAWKKTSVFELPVAYISNDELHWRRQNGPASPLPLGPSRVIISALSSLTPRPAPKPPVECISNRRRQTCASPSETCAETEELQNHP